ncbi:uracil-DNA glycosylase [Thiobacter aerophilum]|uniref:Type-5 uracil-DNA glycosylase n=1 Tax=Thiobacter aerophilum TaxID=3121275 RepID=A0ABV0ED24_9BURK
MSAFAPDCTACPRLAAFLARIRRDHSDYHARPVPAFGDPRPRLLVVGLAPGLHGANRTGRPFTGDYAGILLYETLYRHGFASRPVSERVDDGLVLTGCRITNAVKCLPPQNKPLPDEILRCNNYLRTELQALDQDAAVLALGAIAHDAVLRALDLRRRAFPFAHGAIHRLSGLTLFDSYHCSRYNTQTRRLTPAMFDAVFKAIRHHLERS